MFSPIMMALLAIGILLGNTAVYGTMERAWRKGFSIGLISAVLAVIVMAFANLFS